ncbi:hypothetical protein OG762_52290 (plasmid) [Streptomyces sp. NBC_01136]|uniref:hypothetical protein n=1 Tax=Streptomyces sp. NBC_01136 TaxID=2903754 RepID=UPI002F910E23|nr:hypothetical protein OG762_52290 [Streptomyces sp. NBC_01136]
MYPAATLDDDTVTLAAVSPAPAPAPVVDVAEALRWTWPATSDMYERVYACVAGTYEGWGVCWVVADLLGELAADYAKDVLQLQPSPYVTATAMITGSRATVSVIPAHDLEPAQGVQLPTLAGARMEPSWGYATLAGGPCLYAGVNVINTGWAAKR